MEYNINTGKVHGSPSEIKELIGLTKDVKVKPTPATPAKRRVGRPKLAPQMGKKHHVWKKSEDRRLLQLKKAGLSVLKISKEMGLSYQMVNRRSRKLGTLKPKTKLTETMTKTTVEEIEVPAPPETVESDESGDVKEAKDEFDYIFK